MVRRKRSGHRATFEDHWIGKSDIVNVRQVTQKWPFAYADHRSGLQIVPYNIHMACLPSSLVQLMLRATPRNKQLW